MASIVASNTTPKMLTDHLVADKPEFSVFGTKSRYKLFNASSEAHFTPSAFLFTETTTSYSAAQRARVFEQINPLIPNTEAEEIKNLRAKKIRKVALELREITELSPAWIERASYEDKYLAVTAARVDQKIICEFQTLLSHIYRNSDRGLNNEQVDYLKGRLTQIKVELRENKPYGKGSMFMLSLRVIKVADTFLFHIEHSVSSTTRHGSEVSIQRPLYIKRATCLFLLNAIEGAKLSISNKLLGSGSYGKVTRVNFESRKIGLVGQYAVKSAHGESSNKALLKEAQISGAMPSHPNFSDVVLIRESHSPGSHELVMPLARKDLHSFLKKRGDFSFTKAIQIFHELLLGIEHAHIHGILHRDIKPDNILKTECHVMHTDFGLSEFSDAPHRSRSTISYAPPELFDPDKKNLISTKTDVWSLGATFWKVLCGTSFCTKLFKKFYPELRVERASTIELKVLNTVILQNKENAQKLINALIDSIGTYTNPIALRLEARISNTDIKILKTLLRKMLIVDPSRRLSASDLRTLKIFKKFGLEVASNTHK